MNDIAIKVENLSKQYRIGGQQAQYNTFREKLIDIVGTGFHPELTGRENIYLNGAILGMKKTGINRKFDEIEKFTDTPVDHLLQESGYQVRDIVRKICELMGHDFEASTVAVGELLGQDAAYVIDSTRAREEFDWAPNISLEEGLAGVIAWVAGNWEQIQKEPLEYIHKP